MEFKNKMKKAILIALLSIVLVGCDKWDYGEIKEIIVPDEFQEGINLCKACNLTEDGKMNMNECKEIDCDLMIIETVGIEEIHQEGIYVYDFEDTNNLQDQMGDID